MKQSPLWVMRSKVKYRGLKEWSMGQEIVAFVGHEVKGQIQRSDGVVYGT